MSNLILILIFSTFIISGNMILFDSSRGCDLSDWSIVDDTVMGGRSNGNVKVSTEGHAVFNGLVSLENNGGFSSIQYNLSRLKIMDSKKILIRLKGDGKQYQFRVKADRYDRHSYISHFQTTGEWQTIEIQLNDMYPSFRGMKLELPNFPGKELEEIAFLISNKKDESFKLVIDKIILN